MSRISQVPSVLGLQGIMINRLYFQNIEKHVSEKENFFHLWFFFTIILKYKGGLSWLAAKKNIHLQDKRSWVSKDSSQLVRENFTQRRWGVLRQHTQFPGPLPALRWVRARGSGLPGLLAAGWPHQDKKCEGEGDSFPVKWRAREIPGQVEVAVSGWA